MIIDCGTWHELPDGGKSQRRRVFVDGREISGVYYLDTDAGFVKTYKILQDADDVMLRYYRKHERADPANTMFATSTFDRFMIPMDWMMEYIEDGPVSRTIYGNVDLKPIE
jgi:hypothetical protein